MNLYCEQRVLMNLINDLEPYYIYLNAVSVWVRLMDLGKEFRNLTACIVKDLSLNMVVRLGNNSSKESDELNDFRCVLARNTDHSFK